MNKKEICFLEGGPDIDFDIWWRSLKSTNKYIITEITDLYREPDKLYQLEEKNPWAIFIGTTGIRNEHRKILIETFLNIDYIPEAIIFADDDSALTYSNIARKLKDDEGTISYTYDIYHEEINEIQWI